MAFWDEEETTCARCKVATSGYDDVGEAHYRMLLDRALSVVRAMPNRPRELEDFFYEVHGEVM